MKTRCIATIVSKGGTAALEVEFAVKVWGAVIRTSSVPEPVCCLRFQWGAHGASWCTTRA